MARSPPPGGVKLGAYDYPQAGQRDEVVACDRRKGSASTARTSDVSDGFAGSTSSGSTSVRTQRLRDGAQLNMHRRTLQRSSASAPALTWAREIGPGSTIARFDAPSRPEPARRDSKLTTDGACVAGGRIGARLRAVFRAGTNDGSNMSVTRRFVLRAAGALVGGAVALSAFGLTRRHD